MQERAAVTRRRIMDGAAKVFAQHGFAAATLDEILAEAGMSKGALYFHFRGKDELAQAIIADDARWAHLFDYLASDQPVQDLIDVTHGLALALQTDPVLKASFRMAVEYGTFDRAEEFTTYQMWGEQLGKAFQRAHDKRALLPRVVVQQAVEYVLTSFTGMQIVSHIASGRADLRSRVESWWRFGLPGLVPGDQVGLYAPEGSSSVAKAVAACAA